MEAHGTSRYRELVGVALVAFGIACSPNNNATSVVPTEIPTEVPVATATPMLSASAIFTPAATVIPTATVVPLVELSTPIPYKTATPMPTSTLVPTPTFTPVPPTPTPVPTPTFTPVPPTPTPVPTPTFTPVPPTPTPVPPDYVKWEIGDKVPLDYQQNAMYGVQLMHDYALSLSFLPEIEDDVTVYLYHDIDALYTKYAKLTGLSVDVARNQWTDVAGRTSDDWIFINTSFYATNLTSRAPQIGLVAHELVHIYQRRLSGSSSSWKYDADEVPQSGPFWLSEGIADFLAYQALSEGGVPSFYSRRDRVIDMVELVGKSLYELETPVGFSSIQSRYIYSMLAAELLAARAGQGALIDYYVTLQPGTTWQEAFQKSFGMNIDEYYVLFEKHRDAGFPELAIPVNVN